jgi:hypothetical protein
MASTPVFCGEPPALECGALCGFPERLDCIMITFAHFSTEMGDLTKPFVAMMRFYVFRHGVEALGNF